MLIGRTIVAARLANARALLKRLNRRRKIEAVEATCERLLMEQKRRRGADDGHRARSRGRGRAWLLARPRLRLEHGARLEARREAEVTNPVKAVLDFTASLLTRDTRAAVLRAGLHPGFGTLHVTSDRHDACVYDLLEAFRAPLAEGLTVYLFNNRIVSMDGHAVNEHGLRLLGPVGAISMNGRL